MTEIKKALALKKELDALRPISMEDERRIMDKFRLDWNFHSNSLEGNSLNYGETKALILFGITAQGKPLKDHFEITGHNKAIEWVMDVVKQKSPLTEKFIRELHTLILKESYETDTITPDGIPAKKRVKVGVYKTSPNHVQTKTGETFRFATPEETPAEMADLLNWYREEMKKENLNPIILAAEFHYKFIKIHPFDDGNGRTARILMNFILLQFQFPPVVIKQDDKANYISTLEQADAGVITPFITYIAKNLVQSLTIMIKGAKGESIEEPDDIDKEIALLKEELKETNQPITKLKNKETILEVLNNTKLNIFPYFKKKCKLFEKMYLEVSFSISTTNDTFVRGNLIAHALLEHENKISDYTNELIFFAGFNTFKHAQIKEFNYESKIIFEFDKTKYTVKNSKFEVIFNKLYGEQLSKDEVIQIVNTEVRIHQAFIQKKMQEIN